MVFVIVEIAESTIINYQERIMKLKKTPLLILVTFLTVFLTSALNTWAVEATLNTFLVGSYDTSGSAGGIYISGDYAYVADASSGLKIIDIRNPSAPSLVGSYDTPGIAADVYVSNN